MGLLTFLVPAVIFKKLYSKPYSSKKKQALTDEEKDALEDAKSDR
jgi:hypothetical protein